MTDNATPPSGPVAERMLTRQEILDARDKAKATTKQITEELFGPDDQLGMDEKHTKRTFSRKVGTLVGLAPTYVTASGQASQTPEDDVREYHAAAGQLLDALELKQQFMAYNRSKNNPKTIQPLP